MTSAEWRTAVEAAADRLAEMLVELADGDEDHSTEQIAAAVLWTGLASLLAEPGVARAEEVGRLLHARMHTDAGAPAWATLSEIEKSFWRELAAAAVKASDAALLRQVNG